MSDAQRIPYGAWPSPITADRAAAGSVGLRETRAIGDATTWLERRPQEQGRSVVVRSGPGAEPVDVTPPGTRLEAFVNYMSSGQNISLFVPLTYAYTDSSTQFDFHVAMQEVRLYPDKDTPITVSVHAPGGMEARCS